MWRYFLPFETVQILIKCSTMLHFILVFTVYKFSHLGVSRIQRVIVVSKMHSNEAILFSYKQVKHDYSLPCAYAVICGRFDITVNWDYLHTTITLDVQMDSSYWFDQLCCVWRTKVQISLGIEAVRSVPLLLAHLSHWLKVSICDHSTNYVCRPSSVIWTSCVCQQFA